MAALPVSDDPELFDGLTRAEAVALCVKRAGELTHDQIRFVVRLSERRKGKLREMASDEVVRLRTMVVDLNLAALKRELNGSA